jgi:dienelactone hydrolase
MGDSFAVMGHSMGGGGSLIVGNENAPGIKASIPLTPWRPLGAFPNTRVPSLLIGAQNDILVPVSDVQTFYNSIPNSTPKAYISFAGADHFVVNNPSIAGNPRIGGRYALAWLKMYLQGDMSYRPVIENQPAFHIFQTTLP